MSLIWKKDKNIELINEFIDSNLVEKGNTKNTASAYKNDLIQFTDWLNKKQFELKNLTENNLEAYLIYLGKRGYKASSISRKTACLKAFFKFLLSENYKKNNLMKNINRTNSSKLLPKSLPDNEINLQGVVLTSACALVIPDSPFGTCFRSAAEFLTSPRPN